MQKNKNTGWHFDNSYAQLPELLFSRVNPVPVRAPKVVILNHALADTLGLHFNKVPEEEIAQVFSGNILPEGAEPIAQAYAGHQYGYFTLLGDGRAIVLGEHIAPSRQRLDIQLKGSGRTPYSRQGDGRAALGPMLREYIISEAMYALGIPTTRSLAVVRTGEEVLRETSLTGAILTRVASSHIRVGTFEYIAMRNDLKTLKLMVNYAVNRHYPHLKETNNPALSLLQAVIENQVKLIIHWMRVGFIHGVMNTDNMTISGETIDYGPCAFMNVYNPMTVFSSIDLHGRYAFGNQPKIAQWNLARCAEALLPVLDNNRESAIQMATDAINHFATLYQNQWLDMMRQKLGIFDEENEDEKLINDFLIWMEKNHADYTNTFHVLSSKKLSKENFFHEQEFQNWYQRWQTRLSRNQHPLNDSFSLMKATNPAVIPRNHKVEEVLKAVSLDNNLNSLQHLLEILSTPYKATHSDIANYQSPPENEDYYRTFCGT